MGLNLMYVMFTLHFLLCCFTTIIYGLEPLHFTSTKTQDEVNSIKVNTESLYQSKEDLSPSVIHLNHLKHGTEDEFEKSASQTCSPVGMYSFWNSSLSVEERVKNLMSYLTLEEMQLQMARGGAGPYSTPAPAIVRMGIEPYVWNTNCHRGDQQAKENATAFPQSIGLAASFSTDLLFDVATVASVETRGKHNDFVRRGVYATHTGASCFSPVINVVRDPRWGRIQETYGEDPFMSGELAASFLDGLHGNDSQYVRVTGGCLHVDAYSGPENVPVSRLSFDAKVSDYDLHMTFLPGFKKCVEAGTFSFMCSYNSINGVPACVNERFLTDILRKSWKFKGYVVSDEDALEYVISKHKYMTSFEEVAAAAVKAGVNLELSADRPQPVFLSIVDAVRMGSLTEELVLERIQPLFVTRFRLGLFDPPEHNPYSRLGNKDVVTAENLAKALEAAKKSFVLLKNNNALLPLKPEDFKSVAIIGPMADNYDQMFGNLPPEQSRVFSKTPLEGLREVFPKAQYKQVCKEGTKCTSYDSKVLKELVNGTDLIIAVLGTGPALEAENNDRADLDLPGKQKKVLQDIMSEKGKARIVLILMSAGPLNITFVDQDHKVEAIMECFFPGQATGDAIREVLINKGGNSSPAGRLPLTWPLYDTQIPPITNYSMANRTYRYLESAPLYPFGYGLSYSKFEYEELTALSVVEPTENLGFAVTVKNTGKFDADEVIQCYISWNNASLPVPVRQLAYFGRIHIKKGQEVLHRGTISWWRWAYWEDDFWHVKKGSMLLSCGGQQPDQKKKLQSNVLTVKFTILDSAKISDDL